MIILDALLVVVVVISMIKLYMVFGFIDEDQEQERPMKTVTPIEPEEKRNPWRQKLGAMLDPITTLHPNSVQLKLKEMDPKLDMKKLISYAADIHTNVVMALHYKDMEALNRFCEDKAVRSLTNGSKKQELLAAPVAAYEAIAIKRVWNDEGFDYIELNITTHRVMGDSSVKLDDISEDKLERMVEVFILRRPIDHCNQDWKLYSTAP